MPLCLVSPSTITCTILWLPPLWKECIHNKKAHNLAFYFANKTQFQKRRGRGVEGWNIWISQTIFKSCSPWQSPQMWTSLIVGKCWALSLISKTSAIFLLFSSFSDIPLFIHLCKQQTSGFEVHSRPQIVPKRYQSRGTGLSPTEPAMLPPVILGA